MAKKAVSNDRKALGENSDTIMIIGADAYVTTRGGPARIDVGTLSDNVADFLRKIQKILQNIPSTAGGFTMTEFEVSAEISANGKLGLLGTGVEVGGKGGLTFKFQKK